MQAAVNRKAEVTPVETSNAKVVQPIMYKAMYFFFASKMCIQKFLGTAVQQEVTTHIIPTVLLKSSFQYLQYLSVSDTYNVLAH